MKVRVYLVDIGRFLKKGDELYCKHFGRYEQPFSFCDERQYYTGTLADAIAQTREYVSESDNDAYGVVCLSFLDEAAIRSAGEIEDVPIDSEEDLLIENVVFSVAKRDGVVIDNFFDKTK